MNLQEQLEFLDKIKTLSTNNIETLYDWLENKESERDRETKLRLMSIELEMRKKRENKI